MGQWRKIGMERVLFGSDWPRLHPSEHRAWLDAFPLTAEERALILTGNPARVLGPTAAP